MRFGIFLITIGLLQSVICYDRRMDVKNEKDDQNQNSKHLDISNRRTSNTQTFNEKCRNLGKLDKTTEIEEIRVKRFNREDTRNNANLGIKSYENYMPRLELRETFRPKLKPRRQPEGRLLPGMRKYNKINPVYDLEDVNVPHPAASQNRLPNSAYSNKPCKQRCHFQDAPEDENEAELWPEPTEVDLQGHDVEDCGDVSGKLQENVDCELKRVGRNQNKINPEVDQVYVISPKSVGTCLKEKLKNNLKNEDIQQKLETLYQAEAEVQKEENEISRAQEVASASQQALGEATNHVSRLSSELLAAEEAVQLAARNAYEAQQKVSKHDENMFVAKKIVDDLSSEMVRAQEQLAEAAADSLLLEHNLGNGKEVKRKRLTRNKDMSLRKQGGKRTDENKVALLSLSPAGSTSSRYHNAIRSSRLAHNFNRLGNIEDETNDEEGEAAGEEENLACFQGSCIRSPKHDSKSSHIAFKAAQEAKEAQDAQQIAGAQASHLVKLQLAEKAQQAAEAAEAALAGKQSLVEQLEHEVREAEAVVQEESASILHTQRNLQVAITGVEQAGQLLKALTNAIKLAQSNLANEQRSAEGAQEELAEKNALVAAAKGRVESLLKELCAARQDLNSIKKAACRAEAAARNANSNAQRNRRRLRPENRELHRKRRFNN